MENAMRYCSTTISLISNEHFVRIIINTHSALEMIPVLIDASCIAMLYRAKTPIEIIAGLGMSTACT